MYKEEFAERNKKLAQLCRKSVAWDNDQSHSLVIIQNI